GVMLLVEHLDRPMSLRLLGEEDRLTMRVRGAGDHADRPDLALILAMPDQMGEAADLVRAESGGDASDIDHLAIGTGIGRINAEYELHHVLRIELTLGDGDDETTGMGNGPGHAHDPVLPSAAARGNRDRSCR